LRDNGLLEMLWDFSVVCLNSPFELARLQTFPDEFLFHGSWTETMRQLGNAVPVQLAHLIANDIRRHLIERSS
jgi:site-specific DNA-cytosine methylase